MFTDIEGAPGRMNNIQCHPVRGTKSGTSAGEKKTFLGKEGVNRVAIKEKWVNKNLLTH
jgi:hypothetical protein